MLLSIPTAFQEERHSQGQWAKRFSPRQRQGTYTTNVGVPKTPSSISWFQEHLETFVAQVELETGAGLPEFVEEEFDAFLECGILAHGWVGRRDEQKHLRAWCQCGLELFDSHLEAGFFGGRDLGENAFGEADHLRVADPVGGRDDDLVARVQQTQEGVDQCVLASVGHEDLRCRDLEAGVALGIARVAALSSGRPPVAV